MEARWQGDSNPMVGDPLNARVDAFISHIDWTATLDPARHLLSLYSDCNASSQNEAEYKGAATNPGSAIFVLIRRRSTSHNDALLRGSSRSLQDRSR